MEFLIAIDDADLDVYQKAILIRIARRGVCFESQRNMATGLGISLGKLNATIQKLAKDGWIVTKVDTNSQRAGWAIAETLPNPRSYYEQLKQNDVHNMNDVLPDEQNVLPDEQIDVAVLPHERHLKEEYILSQNKREREPRNTVNGVPLVETEPPELPQADKVDVEMWAAELGQLVREDYYPLSGMGRHQQKAVEFRQVANWLITTYPDLTLEQFKAKWLAYWSQTGLGGKPWLSQIQNLAGEAVRYEPRSESPKVDKQQMASDAWDIVKRNGRRNYARAKEQLNGKWHIVEEMGKWSLVCDMQEDTFRIRFFEAMKRINTNGKQAATA